MASSIGGAGGTAPVQGPEGNGDDKKSEKKATVRLSDGDHTIAQTSSESKSQSTGSKVGDLKKQFEESKGSSVKSKSGAPSKWELTNVPPGTVKNKAGDIDERVAGIKVKVVQKPGSSGTVKPQVPPKPGSSETVKQKTGDSAPALVDVSQLGARGKGFVRRHIGEKILAADTGLSNAVGRSSQPRSTHYDMWDLRYMPEGYVKKAASDIDTYGVIKKRVPQEELKQESLGAVGGAESPGESSEAEVVPGPVVDSNRGELSLVGHIVRNGREVQRLLKEAQPLSESASSSVKEKARKAWATIKAKLAAVLASLRNLLGMIKGRPSKTGVYDDETINVEQVLEQLYAELMANRDLKDYVNAKTGEVTCDVPEDLVERVERLQATIWAYNRLIGRQEQE